MTNLSSLYRAIPSVDRCLRKLKDDRPDLAKEPPALLQKLVSAFQDHLRQMIRSGQIPSEEDVSLEGQWPALLAWVEEGLRPALRPVLNATGIVIHTNLGRSVLSSKAAEAAYMAARGYCNLEMDLKTGLRGSRHALIEELLCQVTGAEAAMAVNNNAAAVMLILDALCSGGEVIVSRGELIEIGGSFRIPDIMAKSGATLVEVGTTNRTHLHDYQTAINGDTAAIFSAHASNFRILGFHCAPTLQELHELAQTHGIPLIYDLGSGSLIDFSTLGLPPDPTVQQSVQQGTDIACFSGDKALGGPQAGIIIGRKALVDKCRKNPLARALRCDKLCLAALEATLRAYLDPAQAVQEVPTPRMIAKSQTELAVEARKLAGRIRKEFARRSLACRVSQVADVSRVGGGAFPECDLPTVLVTLEPVACTPQKLRDQLLTTSPPLIGRLEDSAFCLDPRTLEASQYGEVSRVLGEALSKAQEA